MRFFVTRSSEWRSDGEIREYDNLEECIETILNTENFGMFAPELIISRPDDFLKKSEKCDYEIEIYDTWRE